MICLGWMQPGMLPCHRDACEADESDRRGMGYGNVSERRFAPPQIGVTSVILALESETHGHARRRLWLPLVQRTREPFKGMWRCREGGCRRTVRLRNPRSPRWPPPPTCTRPTWSSCTHSGTMRSSNGIPMVSVCYWALLDHADLGTEPGTAGNAHNVRWFPVDDLRTGLDHTTSWSMRCGVCATAWMRRMWYGS